MSRRLLATALAVAALSFALTWLVLLTAGKLIAPAVAEPVAAPIPVAESAATATSGTAPAAVVPVAVGQSGPASSWETTPQPRNRQDAGLARDAVAGIALPPTIALALPGPIAEVREGAIFKLSWTSTGPITSVRLYCYGPKTKLGGKSRGDFGQFITQDTPNDGEYAWKVPYFDAGWLRLRIAGCNAAGQMVAEEERKVQFRPAEFAGLAGNGTYIAISREHQRLYYYEDNELKRVHLISTGRPGYDTPRMGPSDRYKGRVFYKTTYAWSNKYHSPMPYFMAVTSSGSHGIHATTPSAYSHLGSVASHGCIRQHGVDAKAIYPLVAVGTGVYIF